MSRKFDVTMVTFEAHNIAFPSINEPVHNTRVGTSYLRAPGVVVLSVPAVFRGNMAGFLAGFGTELMFDDYLCDEPCSTPGNEIGMIAGQNCYMSFGPERTHTADESKYLDNIKKQGHGSVLEHANYSILLYGISRSMTHELVRHRVGFAYSQVSQRYVGGKTLRFVERPEWFEDRELHCRFMHRIDTAAKEYDELCGELLEKQQEGAQELKGANRTDAVKRVRQAARSVLPNETEAPIVVTGNIRAWRNMLDQRATKFAEVEIREMAMRVHACLLTAEPDMMSDYKRITLDDGTEALDTPYRKV